MTQLKAAKPVLEFKGRMTTLTILRLLDSSVEVLARELDRRVQQAPALFRHLPVILDVEAVASSDLHVDLPGLVALLRTRELIPLGLRGGDARWAEAAEAAGVPVYEAEHDPTVRRQGPAFAESSVAASDAGHGAASDAGHGAEGVADKGAAAVTAAGRCGMVVTHPVRSGQQIYARGNDLVVLSPVSPGAEVLADGHVHVYGTLSGRALAGVRGDTNARIFCKSFCAELVSIAGVYNVSEQFDEGLDGTPVQLSLHGDRLHVERL